MSTEHKQLTQSPVEAAQSLDTLHRQTAGSFPELIGAGAILAGGVETPSGLLLPSHMSPSEVSAEGGVSRPKSFDKATWGAMNAEQQGWAVSAQSALAEAYKVAPEAFDVFAKTDPESDEQTFTVAHVADHGLHRGSWNDIMGAENEEDFMIDVNGESVDTRTGMTFDVYSAIAERTEHVSGEELPDDSAEGEEAEFLLLLTGEPKEDGMLDVPFGYVAANKPAMHWTPADQSDIVPWFRPAVTYR